MTRVIVHLARAREWRGGEQQVLLLVRSLAQHHPISQLVLTHRRSQLANELAAHLLPVSGIPWGTAWDPRAVMALHRQLRGLRRDGLHPILHAHDSHALALALLCRRLHRVPIVATRRSMTVPGAGWRRPDCVIAISRAVAESLRAADVPPERIAVIPSALAPEHFCEVTTAPAVPLVPTIVALGALTREKGHATLLRALARLPQPRPRLCLIGDGAEHDALASLAMELGIADRVTIAASYASLDDAGLFVQPSHREALGTAVLLAMGRGIPVVASRTGGLVELLEGGAGVLVPPDDPAQLAEAIAVTLADAVTREALVLTARRRVEDYRAARMADQVADVYASVHCDPDD